MNIEISRSFSRKIQLKQYEPAEFFASRKVECDEKEAEEWGKRLIAECIAEVERDIESYKKVPDPEAASPEAKGFKFPSGPCLFCQKPARYCPKCKAFCDGCQCDNCGYCGTDTGERITKDEFNAEMDTLANSKQSAELDAGNF